MRRAYTVVRSCARACLAGSLRRTPRAFQGLEVVAARPARTVGSNMAQERPCGQEGASKPAAFTSLFHFGDDDDDDNDY